MGVVTNLDLISSNAALHNSSKSNLASFSSNLHNGLEIFLEVLYESSVKTSMSWETSYPFYCCRW